MVGTDAGTEAQAAPEQDRFRYRQQLRPIGAYLDYLQARYVTLCETQDGFVWHCFPRGDLSHPLSGMIALADIPLLMDTLKKAKRGRRTLFGLRHSKLKPLKENARKRTICPEGYEELLRSLATKLDAQRVQMVLIVERDDSVIVRYSIPLPGFVRTNTQRAGYVSGFHEDIYNREQVSQLIGTVRGYRGNRYYH